MDIHPFGKEYFKEIPVKKILILHNILWPKYKGQIFSSLHQQSMSSLVEVSFSHIAETSVGRNELASIDLSYHTYPHLVLFRGDYQSIPKFQLIRSLFQCVWKSDADLIVLPGYHRLEFWGMLIACILKGKKRAVNCDSTINDRKQTFFKNILKRIFFSNCDGYFVYGQRSKDYLFGLGADATHIYKDCQACALPSDYSQDTVLDIRKKQVGVCAIPPNTRFVFVLLKHSIRWSLYCAK